MTGGIDLGRIGLEDAVGEVYRLEGSDVVVYLLPDRLDRVRPGNFLYIDTGEGGVIVVAGSKAIDPKYAGKFQPRLNRTSIMNVDTTRLYEFLFTTHPIYEVDSAGNIQRSFRLFVKPHNPVYLLPDDQVASLLGEEPDLSFLRYLDLRDMILVRNLAAYLSRVLGRRLTLPELYKEFLRNSGNDIKVIETITRVFMEVGMGV